MATHIGINGFGIFDATQTKVLGESVAKVCFWHAEEGRFANRAISLAPLVAEKGI